ncbi:MAG TPA: phosphatase PAP2 family protein [Vicinamibacterales bacterium]|jgi:undecaprenyl-diphosphatase|nr:phosphatase PAP2 family protein [Vicinamibacterales bacterium]
MLGWLRGVVSALDASAFRSVLAHRSALLNPLLSAVSYFGAFAWIGLALVLGLLRPNRWPGVYQVILAIGLASLLTDVVVKPLVGRHRPYIDHPDIVLLAGRPGDASFPSSHAANSFAGAYALARVFPEFRAAFWTLAILVAFSRVYVGVHYPLDVVAGVVIGLLAGAFVVGGTPRQPS